MQSLRGTKGLEEGDNFGEGGRVLSEISQDVEADNAFLSWLIYTKTYIFFSWQRYILKTTFGLKQKQSRWV